jgi:quercetin dioxygenase-like cupin family protein
VPVNDTLRLTRRETVIIRRIEPDLLEVEGIWGPNGKPPPKHFHPSQDEHFEVIVGRMTARVDGEEIELGQGDTLDIPAGAVHQMWNASDAEARASWQTRPAGRTEDWFRAVDALHAEGSDPPGPLQFAPLMKEYADVFRLAAAPQPLMRPLVSVLGKLGRARG